MVGYHYPSGFVTDIYICLSHNYILKQKVWIVFSLFQLTNIEYWIIFLLQENLEATRKMDTFLPTDVTQQYCTTALIPQMDNDMLTSWY